MEEVTETALPAWLARARTDGWALVGLEQTAESTSLPAFEWPRRTVLVLGRYTLQVIKSKGKAL